MNKNINKNLAKRKKKISKKLNKRDWDEQPAPMFKASNIQYEIDGRLQGVAPGGIGLIHMLAKKTGLLKEIDKELELLKRHLPYHESDHVANMAYNILAGGTCLQDIELPRNNEAWLNALDAEIIPYSRRLFAPVFQGRYHNSAGRQKYHPKKGMGKAAASHQNKPQKMS